KRVGAPDIADGGAKKIRPFGDGPADEDPAGAGAGASELARARISLLHQVLRAGDEVFPRVRLGCLVTGLVPCFALFAAAPGMGKGKHHPSVCYRTANTEVRRGTDPVSPVALEDAAVRPVEREPLLVNNGERHHGSVVAGNFNFFGDQFLEPWIGDFAIEDALGE